MEKVRCSVERPRPDQPALRVPCRQDFVDYYVARGDVADEGELVRERPDLVHEAILNWVQHSATGCRFATHLAVRRQQAGWLPVTVSQRLEDKDFHRTITAVIRDTPGVELTLLAFPWVETPEDLVELIRQMASCPGWWWEEAPAGATHDGVLVGLRWALPSGKSASWALGLAPFDFMPFTRRAPWTSIVLRPQDPAQQAPKEGLAPVHLAQVPHFLGDRGRYKGEVWTSTERLRSALLAGELEAAAKARVTFNVPSMYRSQLPPAGRHSA